MATDLSQADHDQFFSRHAKSSRIGRAVHLLTHQPKLIPYAAKVAVTGAAGAMKDDATLGWLSSANQVRKVAPDTILGAEWGGLEGFMDALGAVVKPTDSVLEIGSGGGRVTRLVQPLVAHIDAVDVSQPMLDETKKGTEGLRGIDTFVVEGFGDNLGVSRYDLVFSHDVFVHFEFDQVARYAFRIADALKPGGAFVVSVYTLDTDSEVRAYRDELMRKGLQPRRARRMPAGAYERIWKAAGFTVEESVQSAPTEYANHRDFTHLNYVLKRSA